MLPFLLAKDIHHTFDKTLPVLSNISLSIQRGAFVTLVGSSGIGKSTLLRILAGLLLPTKGQILVEDVSVQARSEPIGIVFQRDNLMPWRTVQDNVRLPLELQGRENENGRIREMIKLVGLSGFERSYPAQLSGGMAQRVAIARSLVHQPMLLFLDEPFGALDALTRERMGQELLRIWRAEPVTVFMVTHSIVEAVLLSDEVLVMGKDSNSPAATITHHIPISLPRPRQLDMQGTAVFQQCTQAVRSAIEGNGHLT